MPLVEVDAAVAFAGDCLVVEGPLVGQRAARVADTIMFQCRGTRSTLRLDLAGVDDVDLKGVRALVAASRYAAGRGIELVIDRPSTAVLDALERAGATEGLTIHDRGALPRQG